MLYASRGSTKAITDILTARDEFAIEDSQESKAFAVRHLFHGRPDLTSLNNKSLKIKSISDEKRNLFIELTVVDKSLADRLSNEYQYRGGRISLDDTYLSKLISELTNNGLSPEALGLLSEAPRIHNTVITGSSIRSIIIMVISDDQSVGIIDYKLNEIAYGRPNQEIPHIFVGTMGLDAFQTAQLWDTVYLTPQEDDVVEALRIIEPAIKSVGLVESNTQKGVRIPRVRLSGRDTPILLSSLGEGMNRIFGLTLALVNVKDGFLFVDEIGNGIHYSAQPKLWNFLFQVAEQLNVQLFATTHSWDVIEAFQESAQAHRQVEGVLISLRNKFNSPGEVVGTIFTEQDLEIVTRDQIEIR